MTFLCRRFRAHPVENLSRCHSRLHSCFREEKTKILLLGSSFRKEKFESGPLINGRAPNVCHLVWPVGTRASLSSIFGARLDAHRHCTYGLASTSNIATHRVFTKRETRPDVPSSQSSVLNQLAKDKEVQSLMHNIANSTAYSGESI